VASTLSPEVESAQMTTVVPKEDSSEA
jgi:hypothetical protein